MKPGRGNKSSEPGPDPGETTASLVDVPTARHGDRQHGVLVVLSGSHSGAIFILDQADTIIGRARSNPVWLNDEGMSRMHARITRRGDGYYLEDAGSTNGTSCQGEPVREPRRLRDGDRIAMGRGTLLRFALQDEVEREASRQTVELQIRDPLTRLPNRRHLEERLQSEFAFARRHKTPLFVLMLDLDRFKRINDSHGHGAGDAVLRAVAHTLEVAVRVEDVVGRYGGEEFAIVVRGVDMPGIQVLSERLRRLVEETAVAYGGGALRVTTSIGVAELKSVYDAPDALIAAADKALYAAKDGGRNCVKFA
jgi:diguanylate cyclase (GGDEF)-like protein